MSEDEQEKEEKPFAVERAKTGRAKCKKCKCPIDKDNVRIAKIMRNPFGDGTMKCWHHVTCIFDVFAKQRATTKRIDDPEEDISGWDQLEQEDKDLVLKKLGEFEKDSPFKGAKVPQKSPKENKLKTPVKPELKTNTKEKPAKKDSASTSLSTTKDKQEKKTVNSEDEKFPSRDDMFREFRRLCYEIADASSYLDKTAIVKKMFTKGSKGDGFKSDIVLWCKLLLPGAVKRIYNLQSKQLIKLFARLLKQDENEMLEHLEQGDVAETVAEFFESSVEVRPNLKSVVTIQEVDQFLEKLSTLTKEHDQMKHFKSFIVRCTANDLKMIIRLIKHDLRINSGPKHILQAIDVEAYKAFQVSNNLEAVILRCLGDPSSSSSAATSTSGSKKGSGEKKVALSIMTPVLPMLAEACKSVEMAMKKCPDGMLSEVKYDGERVQVHKKGNEFRYFSRSLKPVMQHKVNLLKDYIPQAFPNANDLILDAEILMIDTKTCQPLPFGTLGVHKKAEFKDANVCLFVFDCIYFNGEILLNKTMKERRTLLEKNLTEIPNRIKLSEVQEISEPEELAEMIAKVLKMGLEGLVLKSVNGTYEPGKRHWLKVKKDYLCGGAMADTADLVVLGAWYGTGHKGGMMSVFLMGCYDTDRDVWLTVTKVHTGHDDATLERLQGELDMVKIGKDPNLVPKWLRANKPMIPDFVAKDPKNQPVWEITGAEFTNQGVHTADGISIRFPRVTRIRSDKNWETATTFNELRNLFKNSSESTDFSLLLSSPNKKDSKELLGKKTKKKDAKEEKSTEKLNKRKIKEEGTLDTFMKKGPKNEDSSEEKPKKRTKLEEVKQNLHAKIVKDVSFIDSADEEELQEDVKVKQEMNTIEVDSDDSMKEKSKKKDNKTERNKQKTELKIKEPGIKIENKISEVDDENRAKFYLFQGRDNSKCVLRNVRVSFASDFKRKKKKKLSLVLKTLGATILQDRDVSQTTHMIHSSTKVPATILQDGSNIPTTARHVHESWVENCATESKMQDATLYAVILSGDYCRCPCPHGRWD
ncbi:DNA ligase 3 isoform X2 [Belonocnema kinseyi]|uniref:DNA ligase 3 isoform X2 n=1 Tax=Belonocnema kinseyi TaxID=2817044 RepID=UPI00143D2952|nr:DNA ligase 3 isoform X2 [Belonocnema kinseyi]